MNRADLQATVGHLFLRGFRPVTIAAIALVLAAGYFGLLDRKIAEVRTVGLKSLTDQRQRLEERRQYHALLLTMIERFRQDVSPEDRDFVNRAVASDPRTPELLTALNAIATASGGAVAEVSVTEPTISTSPAGGTQIDELLLGGRPAAVASAAAAPATSQTLTVRLALSAPGGYATLKTFLDALETSERLLNVTAIRFSLARAASGPEQAEREGRYEVVLTTQFLPGTPAS